MRLSPTRRRKSKPCNSRLQFISNPKKSVNRGQKKQQHGFSPLPEIGSCHSLALAKANCGGRGFPAPTYRPVVLRALATEASGPEGLSHRSRFVRPEGPDLHLVLKLGHHPRFALMCYAFVGIDDFSLHDFLHRFGKLNSDVYARGVVHSAAGNGTDSLRTRGDCEQNGAKKSLRYLCSSIAASYT
jgi:hypothetical protein